MIKLEMLSTGSCEYKVLAFLNNKMVGEITYTLFTFDMNSAVMTDLEVVPKWRRCGIGTTLFNTAVAEILKRSYMHHIRLLDGSPTGTTGRMGQKVGFTVRSRRDGRWWELQRKDFVAQNSTQEAQNDRTTKKQVVRTARRFVL